MNYINELNDFLSVFGYDGQDRIVLEGALLKIANSDMRAVLDNMLDSYSLSEKICPEQLYSEALNIAKYINENQYTVSFVIYVLLFVRLEKIYERKCFDEEIYLGATNDLKIKLEECKTVKGVCGTFTSNWFEKYLNFENFAIGRLQFNLKPMPESYEKDGRSIKKGETVIAIHIPSGGRLEERDVLSAIDAAKEFFKNRLNFAPENFICSTYLFHPSMTGLYKKGSNLDRFCQMFDIFYLQDDIESKDAWRIFGCEPADYSKLPEDTSLQRALKQYLQSGGHMGKGIGVLKKI